MKRWWWMIAGGVVLVGGIDIAILLLAPNSPIPPAVKNQLSSTFLAPHGPGIEIDKKSANYTPSSKVLIYNVQYRGAKIIIAEQATPAQFTDIPQTYIKLVDTMGNYRSFESNAGTVYLTKSDKIQDKQVAVLNTKGTLMFAKSDKLLTDDEWQVFFKGVAAVD